MTNIVESQDWLTSNPDMTLTNATPAKNANFREDYEDSFVGRLKFLAKTRYKSVAGLSRAIEIPDSTLRSWFNGTQPVLKEDEIRAIASKLGVSYEWLVLGSKAGLSNTLEHSNQIFQRINQLDYTNQDLQRAVRLQKLLNATSNLIESLTLTPDQDEQDMKPLWALLEQHIDILSKALASYQANSGAEEEVR